ncbi:MAG: HNH endonuclease [Gaiellales bacterium]|jgi:5-methylcytosine-specific restriction endonuclease McrA
MAGTVLVLNATYEPLNVTSVWRACSLILSGKAEVLEAHPERAIRSPSTRLPHPLVIRLVSYVKVPRFPSRRITRRALFARDGHCCQYCGSGVRLTLDHVVPRSRGGASSWENVVTACAPCNLRKGDRLPHEAGMPLGRAPRAPHPDLYLTLGTATIPAVWRPYLPTATAGRSAADDVPLAA